MKFLDKIKMHCASLKLLFDFSEFSGKFTVWKVIRLVLRILLLVPAFLIYLLLLVWILIAQLSCFFASIPSHSITEIRKNAGYDTKEFKWLFILSYLILYLFVIIFDIILVVAPVFMSVISFMMDAIMWIAHLGKSELINTNITLDYKGNEKTKFIRSSASNHDFHEVVIAVIAYIVIYYISFFAVVNSLIFIILVVLLTAAYFAYYNILPSLKNKKNNKGNNTNE